jgi:uncharacterized membrane protein
MKAKPFLKPEEDRAVVAAIRAAELGTSAEIRILISHETGIRDALAAARMALIELGMTKTAARNAVLIFVAPMARRFAIVGDQAAHEKLGDPVWLRIAGTLKDGFTDGAHGTALINAVNEVGRELSRAFPARVRDQNELPDQIIER